MAVVFTMRRFPSILHWNSTMRLVVQTMVKSDIRVSSEFPLEIRQRKKASGQSICIADFTAMRSTCTCASSIIVDTPYCYYQ